MKRILKVITIAAVLAAAMLFCGCDTLLGSFGGFSHVKGEEYFANINGKESKLVVADDGSCSLSYSSVDFDIDFCRLSFNNESEEVPPEFDVTLLMKNEIVGTIEIENGGYTMECLKCFISLTVEGNDKDAFLKYAKEDAEKARENGYISSEQYKLYLKLLEGKSHNQYGGSVEKLVISGVLDKESGKMSISSLLQYDTEGRLKIESAYNESGVLISKTRYNEAGVAVGVFEYYADGELKKLSWYYDDGSFMNSEEYIRENGLLVKALFKAEDGYFATELYKNGKIYRLEEIDANGIFTYSDYDESGKCIKYSVIISQGDDFYGIGSFFLNPDTEEYLELEYLCYDLDGNVLEKTFYEYDEDYNLTKFVSFDNDGNIQLEERYDDEGRVIYTYSVFDENFCHTRYDLDDCDVMFTIYDLDGTLNSVYKEKDGVGFYSCDYYKSGALKSESFHGADPTLYHYVVKYITYEENGNLIKIVEYETFFKDNGFYDCEGTKSETVYENGKIKTVTEYKNEYLGEGYLINSISKITHYKNGEIISVETF